jgi:hypothetical protein
VISPLSRGSERRDEARGVAEVNILIDASVDQQKLPRQGADMFHDITRGIALRVVDWSTHIPLRVVSVIAI